MMNADVEIKNAFNLKDVMDVILGIEIGGSQR